MCGCLRYFVGGCGPPHCNLFFAARASQPSKSVEFGTKFSNFGGWPRPYANANATPPLSAKPVRPYPTHVIECSCLLMKVTRVQTFRFVLSSNHEDN